MSPLLALFTIQASDPYARLAAIVPKAEVVAVEAYVGQAVREPSGNAAVKPPPYVALGATPLAAQRAIVERYPSVLIGLRQLAEKPYAPLEGAQPTQDSAQFEKLAKFVAYAAHVRFADGDRRDAVTALLDGMTMARRVRGSSTASNLASVAMQTILYTGFKEHLDQIPLAECDRIRAWTDAALAEKTAAPSDASPSIREAFTTPESFWTAKEADPFMRSVAKERTQIRLLRLHMRIEAYRWRNLKLPATLADAAPGPEANDPSTGRPFRYEPSANGYRLGEEDGS